MVVGPFLFAAPLALLGLLALPVIWWLLRATPPMPREAELPSLRLLDDVDPTEETPARTPWWILVLRLSAAGLAALGLAQPIYAPGAQTEGDDGPLLIIVDDGWRSAARWSELISAANAALDTADRDTATHLLLTAPRERPIDPAERLSRQDMARRLASLDPQAWAPDRADALSRLTTAGLRPARILWATDGLAPADGEDFAGELANIAPLSIYAAPPRGAAALTALSADNSGATLRVARTEDNTPGQVFVSALSEDGTALATAEAVFARGATEAEARFDIPPAALARAQRFRLAGAESAGAVFLWDSASRRQRVGLVSTGEAAQPLLSDLHYVRRALEPFAILQEGDLDTLLLAQPDAIVLTDVGRLPDAQAAALETWVQDGGALIRFAGPRLASQGDTLTPTPLRRASRSLGGALAWDEPQDIAAFPTSSPFLGLTPPADAKVRQQVLARPTPELDRKTWARLADGSPVVTADRRGDGTIVLFHVTAGPDWSDLPFTGVFVDMLRRAVAAGQGQIAEDETGLFIPQLALDGFGRLRAPQDTAAPLQAADFATATPSERHPPGLYQGASGTRAINVAADFDAVPITDWPASATLLGDAESRAFPLAGALIGLALALLAVDLFVALVAAGRFPALGRAAAGFVFAGIVVSAGRAEAQFFSDDFRQIDPRTASRDDASDPALEFRLAFIETGDAELDELTLAGLRGLTRILYLRTSVEPIMPDGLDLEEDPLELYPLIYFAVPETPEPLSPQAVGRLNQYLRSGGALVIDTRSGDDPARSGDISGLEALLQGLDAPPLTPTPTDHVLSRSFYLLDDFPGRYSGRRLWIEAPAAAANAESRGDGVSRLFIGDADWAAAWATDGRGRPIVSVDGGERQREIALRFGVNLVMYVLTGSYKDDQVHLPALLERLNGEDADEAEPEPEAIP